MPHPDPGPRRRRPPYDLDRLVSVSARVFGERGYDGTSMADLARATGLTKPALYHHAEGKEHLLRLALERAVVPLVAIADESLALPGRAADRLRYLVTRQVGLMIEVRPYMSLLTSVRGNTETGRWALKRRLAFEDTVTALVAEAVDEQDLSPTTDPRLVGRLLCGMVDSIAQWHESPDGEDIARTDALQLADAVIRLACAGLRAVPGSPGRGARPPQRRPAPNELAVESSCD
ncbi:TetR family transcriptional regulator [Streptomyces canus]|uniref:TetR/AcrR family transcriptional regulator n=1 Tax=Streptomyces canus TaxID=58343 RepID=UPI0036EA7464